MPRNVFIFLALALSLAFFLWQATRSPHPQNTEVPSTGTPLHSSEQGTQTIGDSRFHATAGVQAYYSNDTPHFFFAVPDGFIADPYQADIPKAQAILVTNTKGLELDVTVVAPGGYQVPISDASVHAQFPGRVITNEKAAQGPDGTNALSFEVDSTPSVPPMQVLWFVHGGYLYELTTALDTPSFITYIVSSWSWGT